MELTKVLFYCHTGHVSGAERVLLSISRGLDREVFMARLAAPTGQLHEPGLVADLETRVTPPLNARFTRRPDLLLRYAASFVRVILDLRSEIRAYGPAIIHAATIRSGIAASLASWQTDAQVIWNLCDILPSWHPFNTAIRWLAILHGRSHMLAASKAAARSFQGKLLRLFPDRVPIHVIHNGVDVQRFSPNPSVRARSRDELKIDSDTCVFGIVGQITPRKGHLGLIHSFASVVRERPNSLLLVVGAPMFNNDSEYLEQLESEVRRLGLVDKVEFLGSRGDVGALLQAIDVLVLNSEHEPFSLVLLEAQASGTPIVATNVDGVPELIQDQVTGMLVPPQDEGRLAQALLSMAAQPSLREAFSQNGRTRVTEHFSAAIFRGKVNSLYRSLAPALETVGATPSGQAIKGY